MDEQNLLPIWNAKMGEETMFGYYDDSYGNEFVFFGEFLQAIALFLFLILLFG